MIPESKFVLHEIYCIKNIIKCKKCGEAIDKSDIDNHENEIHKIVHCEYCND